VRALFKGVELREMAHHQKQARCCGTGKLLPFKNPALAARLKAERVSEFAQTDSDYLISYCVNCAQSFNEYNAYHYLELLFDSYIDWTAVEAAVKAAVAGVPGDRTRRLLKPPILPAVKAAVAGVPGDANDSPASASSSITSSG
jgi:hypothetical protein